MSPTRLALALFLAAQPMLSAAQSPAPELAGMRPGLSPAAAVSRLARALPGWERAPNLDPAPEEAASAPAPAESLPAPSFTEQLAHDCKALSPHASRCQARLASPDGQPRALIALVLDYAWSEAAGPRERSLARARTLLSLEEPASGAWAAFVASKGRPSRRGAMARELSVKAFESDPDARARAGLAQRFEAALWQGRTPEGLRYELAALAALDANGRLLALSAEIGRLPRDARPRGPTLP